MPKGSLYLVDDNNTQHINFVPDIRKKIAVKVKSNDLLSAKQSKSIQKIGICKIGMEFPLKKLYLDNFHLNRILIGIIQSFGIFLRIEVVAEEFRKDDPEYDSENESRLMCGLFFVSFRVFNMIKKIVRICIYIYTNSYITNLGHVNQW